VCMNFLLYLSVYLCFARCVFCVQFHIHTHIFPNSMCTYVTKTIDIHIAWPICLSLSSIYIFISLIYVYARSNSYTHLPPSSRTFMFPSKSTSISPISCRYFHPCIGRILIHISPLFLCIYIPILICTYLPIIGRITPCPQHYCSLFKFLSFHTYPYSYFLSLHTYPILVCVTLFTFFTYNHVDLSLHVCRSVCT